MTWKQGFYSSDGVDIDVWIAAGDAEATADPEWGICLPFGNEGPDAVDPAAFWATLAEHAPELAKALVEAAPRTGKNNPHPKQGEFDHYRRVASEAQVALGLPAAGEGDDDISPLDVSEMIQNLRATLEAVHNCLPVHCSNDGELVQCVREMSSEPARANAAQRAGVTAAYPSRVRPIGCNTERLTLREANEGEDFVFMGSHLREWEQALCDQLGDGEYHMHITLVEADE